MVEFVDLPALRCFGMVVIVEIDAKIRAVVEERVRE